MYQKCSKCGKPLTEFDVNFIKNLNGSFNEENCQCANCTAKTNDLHKIKKPNIFKYLLPYLALIYYVYFFSNVDSLTTGPNSELYSLLLVAAIAIYITFSILCTRDFESLKDETFETDCIRTTYDSSTNSLVTSSSKETIGDDHISEKIWLTIIYPIWGIFVLIYRIFKYYNERNKNFTKEVIKAYDKTVKETEKYFVSDKVMHTYGMKKCNYQNLKQTIKSKYSYQGKDVINNKIKEIKKPMVKLKSNRNSYNLLFLRCVCFVVDNLNNYKIIVDNYAVYITNKQKLLELINLLNKQLEINEEDCSTFVEIEDKIEDITRYLR